MEVHWYHAHESLYPEQTQLVSKVPLDNFLFIYIYFEWLKC